MPSSTSTWALAAGLCCLSSPYLASALSQLSLAQRIAASLVLYLVVSAQLQHRSAKRFRAARQEQNSRTVPREPQAVDAVAKPPPLTARPRRSSPSTPKAGSVPASHTTGVESKIGRAVARIHSEQCPQLLDACYLDAAAAPPYPSGLVKAVADELSCKLLSNPHSKSPSAISTADQIASIRLRIMHELFGIQDTHNWHLVFTSGTTASLKLVGESFDWHTLRDAANGKAGFSYLRESHTSAVGIRDLASREGITSSSFTEQDDVAGIAQQGLVVLPLQCNATGRRYTHLLKRVCRAKAEKTLVLVDAASYLSSATRLDLSRMEQAERPDMIAFSFYKIFGYPTGLGGLLVKASAVPRLSNKTYFGGGAVDSILAESRWTKPRKEVEARFEDGTVNIHGILAVNKALDYYHEAFGPWDDRSTYVADLRAKLWRAMQGLKHGNDTPVLRLYSGADASCDAGPIVNFNVLTATGAIVPPQEVDRLASISNVHLRMGRHCNPGFVTSQLGATPDRLKQEYADGVGCDDAGDSPVGGSASVSASLRASLCLLNTDEDIERLVGFIARFFLSSAPNPGLGSVAPRAPKRERRFELANITVYPIKSCSGQNLAAKEAWKLTQHGLEYDREWIVMNLANGKALSQKRFPKMALIRPRIDLTTRCMIVSIAGTDRSFSVNLDDDAQYMDDVERQTEKAKICGDEVRPRAHKSETLRRMLTDLLGVSCTLARQATDVSRHSKLEAGSDKIPLIFSNESPFLLINSASVDRVSEWIKQDLCPSLEAPSCGHEELASDSGYSSGSVSRHTSEKESEAAMRVQAASFRSNFLISPLPRSEQAEEEGAFAEDGVSRVVLGGQHIFGVLGECRRCQMVCVDQETGQVKPQTLKTLAKHRRNDRGRIIFGSHLAWLPDLAPGRASGSKGLPEEEAHVWVGMDVVTSW